MGTEDAAWRITTMRAASSALLVLSGVVALAAIPAGADCRPACTGLHAQLPGAALASANSHEELPRANSIKSRMERARLPVGRTPSPTALGSDVKRSDSSMDAALESAATAAALAVSTDDSAKAKALDSRARALLARSLSLEALGPNGSSTSRRGTGGMPSGGTPPDRRAEPLRMTGFSRPSR